MKKRNITTILLTVGMAISIMTAGCGDGNTNHQETGAEMQEESDATDENADSDGDGLNKLVNPLGDELNQVSEELKEKVNDIVENAEKVIEEKKEGN